MLTLLNWILLISRFDWGAPGYCCLRIWRMVSALSSNCSLFSKLTIEPMEPQEDLVSLLFIFLFQIMHDASILFFRSTILCSVDRSNVSRKFIASNCSSVMLLYIASPRLTLPFYNFLENKREKMSLPKSGWSDLHYINLSLIKSVKNLANY